MTYWVRVDSGCGATDSRTATVTVLPTPLPEITGVSQQSNPFRILVSGSGFQTGLSVYLAAQATPWPKIRLTGATELVVKGASSLFPKDDTWVRIQVLNPDGGQAVVEYNRKQKAWRVPG
jgi:hypothetical protein